MSARRFLASLGLYSVLGFLPLGVNLLLLPLYVVRLPPAELGLVSAAMVTQTVCWLLLTAGLDGAYARLYFDHHRDRAELGALTGAAVAAATLHAAALGLVLAAAGAALTGLLWRGLPFWPFVPIALFAAWLQQLGGIAFLHQRNEEALPGAAAVSLAQTAALLVGTAGAVLLVRADGATVMAGRLVASLGLVVPVLARWGWRATRLAGLGARLRGLYALGLPLLAYTVVAYTLGNGDRWLVERWFGLEVLGWFALAVGVAAPLEAVFQAGQQAATPRLYRLLERDVAEGARAVQGFFLSVAAVVSVLALLLMALVGPLLELLRGRAYGGAVALVPVLAAAQVFRVVWASQSFALFHARRTGPLPAIALAALAVGGLTAWAARGLGPLAVALGVLGWKAAQVPLTALVVRGMASARGRLGPGVALALGVTAAAGVVTRYGAGSAPGVGAVLLGLLGAGAALVVSLRGGWVRLAAEGGAVAPAGVAGVPGPGGTPD